MNVVDVGTGPPLILVPGIQGRWEYMRPAVAALSAHFRVLTFSLSGERHSGRHYDSARGFDDFADQLEAVLDARGISSAIVCGVSFGGLIALRFAARRPDRTLALVLASTPGPGWHLRRRHDVYTRLPWIFGPVFLAEAPGACATSCTRPCPIVPTAGASRALNCGPFWKPRCRFPAWRRVPA